MITLRETIPLYWELHYIYCNLFLTVCLAMFLVLYISFNQQENNALCQSLRYHLLSSISVIIPKAGFRSGLYTYVFSIDID